MAEQQARHHGSQITEIDLILSSEVAVQVLVFDLDLHPDEAALVNSEELKRADGFARDSDRRHFIARRSILRSVLVERSGLDPSAIRLESDSRGKPVLPSRSKLRFNASRSDRWFGVVLTHSAVEPGIDIECLREIPDVASVSRRMLSSEEIQTLGEEFVFDSESMLRMWTRKEAVLKSLGVGLGIDPSQVTVPLVQGRIINGSASVRNGSAGHEVILLEPDVDSDAFLLSVGVAKKLVDPVRD